MKKFINKIKNNKVLSILSVLIIGLFFILVARITYAYLAPVINDAKTNVVGSTDTVDDFKFELGNPLKIDATPTTLKENGSNYTTSTTAKALLKANSTKNTSTYNYYVYFQIKSNTFTYSDGSTPEIILTVTSPNGDEITSIDGLTYGTFNGVSGFDVTTKSGLFNIANNHEITSNSSTTYTTQSWTIKITYLNLSIDQSTNFGNSMDVNIYITKNEKILLTDYVISQYTGIQGDNSLYHHDSTLANGAGDNSYRYAGGDYKLTDAGKATGATVLVSLYSSITTTLIDFYCNESRLSFGGSCDSSQSQYYIINGDTVQYQTYNEALSAAVDKGYVTKDNVQNYVCFGSDIIPCPVDNLYRIIGVIDGKIKLIKNDYMTTNEIGTDGDYLHQYNESISNNENFSSVLYLGAYKNKEGIGAYLWNYNANQTVNDGAGSNIWHTSLLNKVNLNVNFMNYIGVKWANKIAMTKWCVGGNMFDNILNVSFSDIYVNEIKNPNLNGMLTKEEASYDAKIGLMYVSDYVFASNYDFWGNGFTNFASGNMLNNNWMFMGLDEYSITPNTDKPDSIFGIENYGDVDSVPSNYNSDGSVAVRAVFNLSPSVTYIHGDGTKSDPIIID